MLEYENLKPEFHLPINERRYTMSKTFTNTSALKAALLKDTREAVKAAIED